MPQIQTPKTQQGQAVNVQENKLFRERLLSRFQPHQFVRVINIDDEPFIWQYMPSTAEEESFTDNGAVRVVTGRKSFTSDFSGQYPGNEQQWLLNPGDSEVLIGESAFIMIEGLYKRLVAKNKINATPDQEATKARNFNWNDGKMQEDMIDKIFLGVENPRFNEPARAEKPRG